MSQRVLYVYDGKLTYTGIDAVVRRQLTALSDFPIDLVSRGEALLNHVSNHGSRLTWVNLFSWLPRNYYYPLQKRLISKRGARFAQARDYQFAISWPQRALACFGAASKRGIPCFLNHDTMHYSHAMKSPRRLIWPEYRRAELQAEYDLATKIMVPSEYSLSTFLEAGIAPEKLVVIGRGVDTTIFFPRNTAETRPFRMIFCGRVSERKGIRQILKAWRDAALPEAELLIVGSLDKEVQDLREHPQGKGVRFYGHQANPAPLMQGCDAQILLSRHEGMAKSLLEGAACGLATLATERCGFPLKDGVNGFLVDRKKPEQIVQAMRFLYENRDQCRQMGVAGHQEVESNYSWECFSKRFRAALGL